MTYLDFLRAGSPLHRVTPCETGFSIAPVGEDPAAREAFQAVAEVAVEREGQGYRVADVSMSEVSGGYEAVFVVPLKGPLQT
ncbi:hypothetical protein [Caulobacter sp. 17J80-11]|uniref:hypothetical protein n=1 Tax=Caulobacter sp. 17J80-11 TaxID=2763502 RepID=UPI00165394E8|nr:hypothetical protein [Caulobacter sp. 17J80-11]MBC6982989.1 hypothetical protein [Caulobacter sp. 17J80-11]